jgi:hypothetical protein
VPNRVREVSRRASPRELCSILDDRVLGLAGEARFSAICNVESSKITEVLCRLRSGPEELK